MDVPAWSAGLNYLVVIITLYFEAKTLLLMFHATFTSWILLSFILSWCMIDKLKVIYLVITNLLNI